MPRHFNDSLYHHGVKGQQWGRRRYQYEDGSLTPDGKARYASNYRPQDRAKDEMKYGRKGMERINKDMREKGYGVGNARALENQRLNNARLNATLAGVAGNLAGNYVGTKVGYKIAKHYVDNTPGLSMKKIVTGIAIAVGTMKVGEQLGEYGGQSLAMIAAGYRPKDYERPS